MAGQASDVGPRDKEEPSAPVDCDLHPGVPSTQALIPYFEPYWREMTEVRALDRLNFSLTSYPQNAPLSCRPDWKRPNEKPGSSLEGMRADILDPLKTRFGILNCLHGAQAMHSEDMAAVFCRAVNTWIRDEWLERDSRLRASIVIPAQNPELAVEEIERCAADRRFVQVLMLLMGETTLGRRHLWPIYRAAERLGLPIGIHAGSAYRYAPTSIGWPSYYLEDYVVQSAGFEGQLQSLISEGVFAKFPALKVVLIESGMTWLPGFIWRADKTWRGVRAEVPWVTRQPSELIRDHIRLTVQPIDSAAPAVDLLRLIDRVGSDEIFLFSTDYPHWQFEGQEALPHGLSSDLIRKITSENPLATYGRLSEIAPRREEAA
jgi:predicted TIM-barrel fold metal-dependent hydrolase